MSISKNRINSLGESQRKVVEDRFSKEGLFTALKNSASGVSGATEALKSFEDLRNKIERNIQDKLPGNIEAGSLSRTKLGKFLQSVTASVSTDAVLRYIESLDARIMDRINGVLSKYKIKDILCYSSKGYAVDAQTFNLGVVGLLGVIANCNTGRTMLDDIKELVEATRENHVSPVNASGDPIHHPDEILAISAMAMAGEDSVDAVVLLLSLLDEAILNSSVPDAPAFILGELDLGLLTYEEIQSLVSVFDKIYPNWHVLVGDYTNASFIFDEVGDLKTTYLLPAQQQCDRRITSAQTLHALKRHLEQSPH